MALSGQLLHLGLRDSVEALALAGRFLTRWPFPAPTETRSEALERAPLYYPLIGALLGAALACLALITNRLIGGTGLHLLTAASLLLGFWVWSTGALHLDGLADCADAWVGGLGSRERTLAIMKDPHIGAMGVVALILLLLVKLTALASLLAAGGGWVVAAVPILARSMILWLLLTTGAALPAGLGAQVAAGLPRRWAIVSALLGTSVALAILASSSIPAALLTGLAAGVLLWSWRAALLRRLGGYTGDGIGALVELTEALALLVVALTLASDARFTG
jgi:adenosylcobinamide-GDP ribazoletransferase